MSVERPIGVLVMAYGAPTSLDEIPGYLADIRSGEDIYSAFVADCHSTGL